MKKTTLATLIVTLAAGSAFAAAPIATTDPVVTPTGHEHGGPGGDHKGFADKMFNDADTSKDGSISKEEWTARGDAMFAERDANKDGKISKDEVKAHHDLKRAEWQKKKVEGAVPATPVAGAPADKAPAKR